MVTQSFTEILLYNGAACLAVFYFVFLIITASMFARQKNSTEKPNQYLSDRIILFPSGYTKKLKVMALITFTGYLVLLPSVIAYGIGYATMKEREWIPAAITFVIAFIIWIIIATKPFTHRESCLIIDEQKVTVKYKDSAEEDKVFYISRYANDTRETKYVAKMLVFEGVEGKEELSLHFLRSADAAAAATFVDFIKKNGRMPVVQQVASKQEAVQRMAEQRQAQRQADNEAFIREQQELINDGPRYRAYLEKVYAKIPDAEREKISDLMRQNRKIEAVKEAREFTGEGLRIAKDLVETFFE